MNTIFLGLGSNLGDRMEYLGAAVKGIEAGIGHIDILSPVYETEPWRFNTNEKFLNMTVRAVTDLSPMDVLRGILKIELMLGRLRTDSHYTSRVIDIDLLIYEDQVIDTNELIVPHPLMHERKFVLVPLCDIAPDFIHPKLKVPMLTLLELCEDKNRVAVFK